MIKPKYRAWDKEESRMVTVMGIVWDNDGEIEDINWAFNPGSGDYSVHDPIDRFDIMQYTDKQDKAKIEIYEKDILEVLEENDNDHGFSLPVGTRVVVNWLNDRFSLCGIKEWNELKELRDNPDKPYAGLCPICGAAWHGMMSENHEMPIGYFAKIIGNIYENKDLLK